MNLQEIRKQISAIPDLIKQAISGTQITQPKIIPAQVPGLKNFADTLVRESPILGQKTL